MRWSLRCKSEGLPAAAARYSASSSVIRSPSKKACGRPSGRLPTCLWHAGAGYKSRVRLIRLGWCSSTAANTKMLRLSGRCLRGDRLVGHVSYGHWKTTSRMSNNVSCQRSSAMSSSSTTSLRTKFPCAREARSLAAQEARNYFRHAGCA